MRINHNMMAMNTSRQLNIVGGDQSKSMEKLSSGYRINRAGDDAAGLAISEKMRAQVRGLNQASRNAQDGISLIQTAEGALNETHAILQRVRELAVQSSNDTNVSQDRDALQQEVDQLVSEIDRISSNTEFNTQNLLDGEFKGQFQIGANEGQTINLEIDAMSATNLGLTDSIVTETKAVEATNKLADGTYTIDATGAKVLDGDGNVVGAYAANKITADGADAVAFDKAILNAGDKITIKDGKATVRNDIAPDSTNNLDQLAPGEYKIVGTNVVKDDKVVGDYDLANNKLVVNGKDITFADLGYQDTKLVAGDTFTVGGAAVSDKASAQGTISTIDAALKTVSNQRSTLGAVQNRLEHTIKNLDTSSENLQAAESRIRDVDMAKEMMEFTKNNILSQASQAMLAQANQSPQGVLQLLR